MLSWQDLAFIYTVLIFVLGLINISFALIGVLCYIGPFVLYLKYRDKTWCQKVCPRASFLNKSLSKISLHLKRPKWLSSKEIKDFFVIYLGLNFLVAVMSTLGVVFNRIEPIAYVRLFMFYKVPFDLPQLISLDLPSFLTHFSFRIFSMLLSTVILGLVLGFLYAPRTWCTICPVNTLSTPRKLKNKETKKI